MSLQDELYLSGPYYVDSPAGDSIRGPQTDDEIEESKLPWKIKWDPDRGSTSLSREIITIDMAMDSVSSEDPVTYERRYNPSSAEATVPLRHSLFDAANNEIRIWVLRENATDWSAVDNAVGIEGVDAEARFFVRRDIPLSGSGELESSVGKELFLGNNPFDWTGVTHIRIELLYLGDYVQPDSFRQDLHEEANVTHRTLEVDLDSSSQFQNTYRQTARHTRVYKDFESPFIKGRDRESGGHSSAVLGDIDLHKLQVTKAEVRFGIHDIVYSNINPETIGQAHAGSWPTTSEYYEIDSAHDTRPDDRNFILSHLQYPREDVTETPDEHDREVALQYDADERTWQIGGAYDSFRRTYEEDDTPTLARRYPSIARFVQGRTSATNQGFDFTSNPPGTPLNAAAGSAAMITTWPGDPTLLQVHPSITFEEDEEGNIFFDGMTELRLYSPDRPGSEGRFIEWTLDNHESTLNIGHSGTYRQSLATTTYSLAPLPSSNSVARVHWEVNNTDPAAGFLRLAVDPVSADGVYGPPGVHDVIRFGLTGQGTTATIRNLVIGQEVTGFSRFDEISREANVSSAFDIVFTSRVVPHVKGNMRIDGILDTFSDISLGRDQSGSSDDYDTLDRAALINGLAQEDYLSLGRATDGEIDLRGSTLNYRRLFGPTIARLDLQMKRMLGYEEGTIPGFDSTTYRDYKPHQYSDYVESSKDVVDEDTGVTLRSSYSGKVDAYDQRRIQYDYDGGNVVKNDLTDNIVDGIPYVDGEQVLSGFPRGQLHKQGYTARAILDYIEMPVTITDRGIPNGEDHQGNPEHALNSSDMYLDADGEWRYLFDKVYLPVETN